MTLCLQPLQLLNQLDGHGTIRTDRQLVLFYRFDPEFNADLQLRNTGDKTEIFFKKGRKMKLYPLITDEDKQIKFIQSSKSPSPVQEMNFKECQKCLERQAWGPRVDEICKTVFPGSFLIFAIVYWVHYLRIYNDHLL
ncbi:hypothetical protein AVEN_204158-1 [Araneus ventricosus]|uniref:Uncharacterized protein n=1 Tax=Araneus ventricosus TaxID=182803 RepID=A0A4Y2MI83_ARAVE|nr:hypothetical protein AVEN_204158-1 [Araneus ventricosus]